MVEVGQEEKAIGKYLGRLGFVPVKWNTPKQVVELSSGLTPSLNAFYTNGWNKLQQRIAR